MAMIRNFLAPHLPLFTSLVMAQAIPILCAISAVLFYLLIRKKKNEQQLAKRMLAKDTDSLSSSKRADLLLVQNVIKRGFAVNEADYIEWVGERLVAATESAEKAKQWSRSLAIVGFAGSGLSSVITGAGFFGILTIPLSFVVTSIGTFALGILTLLSLSDKSIRLALLSDNIRLELAQLLGSSDEYAVAKTISDEFQLFATSISTLLGKAILEEAESAAKALAASDKSDTKNQEDAKPAG
jgi:hypothetical protein